jgi:large subunit ribosomal protein L10
MARPEKVAAVEEIREKLTSADATVLTEYRGLTVPEIARLRESLKDAGAQYKVFKNTLARRAAEAAELPEIIEQLQGPTAFAFVEGDVVGTAKALRDFGKTNEHLVVKGGLLNGAFITPEQVDELAQLPSRDELLAKIAGGFKAPMQKAAGLFSAIQRNMAYGLKALIDKRVEGGEELPADEAEATDDTAPAAEAEEAPAEAAAEAPEPEETEAPAEEVPAEPEVEATPEAGAAEAAEPEIETESE